jgi:hypothetical protein
MGVADRICLALYVILNLLLYTIRHPGSSRQPSPVFILVYMAVAIGVSTGSAVLLYRRTRQLVLSTKPRRSPRRVDALLTSLILSMFPRPQRRMVLVFKITEQTIHTTAAVVVGWRLREWIRNLGISYPVRQISKSDRTSSQLEATED